MHKKWLKTLHIKPLKKISHSFEIIFFLFVYLHTCQIFYNLSFILLVLLWKKKFIKKLLILHNYFAFFFKKIFMMLIYSSFLINPLKKISGTTNGNTCLFLTIRCLSLINKLREIAPNTQSWSHMLKCQFTLLNIVCFLIRILTGDKDPLHLKWNEEFPFHDLD